MGGLRSADPACNTRPGRLTTRRVLAFGLLACAVLSVGGCSETSAKGEPDGTAGRGLEVRRASLVETILLTGELQAEESVILSAPNVNIWPLTVRYIAEDGAAVSKGDVVVEFDNSQLVSNLEEVRTMALEASNLLASQRSRVAAEVSEAAFEVERRRAVAEKAEIAAAVPAEILSSREYAESQLALKRARLDLSEAEKALESVQVAGEADVRIQQIALESARDAALRAEASMEKLSLQATRDGIAVRASNRRQARPMRAGDAAWPGLAVARLPDLETLFVKARLFDVDDGRVSPGQRVWATLDAFPETRIAGRVRVIDAVAEETNPFSARRFFDVTIDLDDVDPLRMRPGMSVKVVIEGELLENVLLVQREALDLSGETALARRADGDWVEIGLGACDARQCVVLDGLEQGERLRRIEVRQTTGKI